MIHQIERTFAIERRAPIRHCGIVYGALVNDCLSLSPVGRAYIARQFSLSDDEIDRLRVRETFRDDLIELICLHELDERCGLHGVPGFYQTPTLWSPGDETVGRQLWRWRLLAPRGAFLIPLWRDGAIRALRVYHAGRSWWLSSTVVGGPPAYAR